MKVLAALLRGWTWRMACRDSRSSRRRLVLFATSISLGIAALVAVGTLGQALRTAIGTQAKALLGADLVLSTRTAFTDDQEALFGAIPGTRARETSFSSMLVFPRADGSRLVNVRALEGDFPFYGRLETDPPGAAAAFRDGSGVLIEEGLARQFGVGPGDPVRLGILELPIVGLLRQVPGDAIAFSTIAPRVYVAASRLPETGLLQGASLARYRVLFRVPDGFDPDRFVRENNARLKELRLGSDTVERRKRDLGRSLENLSAFLNLVAFIALLLGGVGIASTVHVHVRQRLPQVAVLRCLGAPLADTFAIYLAQAIALGALGSAIGIGLGFGIQGILPRVLAGVLPFAVDLRFSPAVALGSGATGIGIAVVFALLPLLEVRRVSPLAAIRAGFSDGHRPPDPLRHAVHGLIAVAVTVFAVLQTRHWEQGLGFAAGLGAAFGILTLAALGVTRLVRRFTPAWLPFTWRQGLASLHRPQNRTTTLVVALGLGTFLLLTLQLTRATLLTGLFPPDAGNQPNAILFDIQSDQRDDVAALLRELDLPLLDEAPIITMRLQSVKGTPVRELLDRPGDGTPNWVLTREYRSTWRRALVGSERLTAGEWVDEVAPDAEVIPVSVETGIAEDLGLGIGDGLVFDVQGVPVSARVTSLREVEWRQVRPNFFMVFPAGALEAAPAMHVLATRCPTPDDSARLQRGLAGGFPNVSVVDLALVLETLNGILSKVGFVIRFMALFTVLTGLVVLAGSLVTGRWQRVRECILLRTLGATRARWSGSSWPSTPRWDCWRRSPAARSRSAPDGASPGSPSGSTSTPPGPTSWPRWSWCRW